jgi:hypothetical protein
MRIILGLLALIAIGGGVVAHRQQTTAAPLPTQVAPRSSSVPAPSPGASQHNWPKTSLDRANDVKRQVLEQRKSDGTR